MLSGWRTFDGETVSDTMAAILKEEPDWSQFGRSVPGGVQRLMKRCLTKSPRDRLHDIADARLVIADSLAAEPSADLGEESDKPTSRRSRARLTAVFGALVVAALAGYLAGSRVRNDATEVGSSQPVFHGEIDLSGSVALALDTEATGLGYDSTLLDLSPDGKNLVYVGSSESTSQLFIRSLDSFEVEELVGTEGAKHPFFSPDGRSVGFLTDDSVKVFSLANETTLTLCETSNPVVATWTDDDQVYFSSSEARRLMRVSASGGTWVEVAEPRAGFAYGRVLPGGHHVLVTYREHGIGADYAEVLLMELETGNFETLVTNGYDARYVASGHLLYGRGGSVSAVEFDLESLEVVTDAVPVVSGVRMHALYPYIQLAASATGTLAYVPGGDAGVGRVAWIDRQGNADFLPIQQRVYGALSLSADDRQIAIHVADSRDYVLIYDMEREEAKTAEHRGQRRMAELVSRRRLARLHPSR